MIDLLKKKTIEQKRDAWEKIIDGRAKRYQEMFEHEKIDTNRRIFMKLIKLEFEGGDCWICKKPWKRKEFDNDFLCGFYYVPVCECFIRCPACKAELYDLQYKYNQKLEYCDNCHFKLFNKATKTKRYGADFEIYYNDLSDREKYCARAER